MSSTYMTCVMAGRLMLERTSLARMNTYHEKGSPCLMHLLGLN